MKPIETQADIEEELAALLKLEPALSEIAKICGTLPLRLQGGGFPGLARIIVGQQVSRASAEAIWQRFVNEIKPVTPSEFLKVGEGGWKRIGLSRPKQKSIAALADALILKHLELEEVVNLEAQEAINCLTSIHGIGPWTAEVYLLFCAGHRDIFPAGDLALQEAIKIFDNLEERPDAKQTRKRAENWAPHRGVAARLFWAYYTESKQGRSALPV